MSISFSGLASGLDTSSWITSLTQLRQAKVTKLEEQKSSVVAAQSTLQGIRSYFASFRSSLEKITDSKFKVSSMDIFAKKLASVSNSAVLSATAKSNAAEGSYEVKVNNTATQTQVKSGYRYKTVLVSTTQATTSSILKNIGIGYGTNPDTGITSGTIEITHDGVKSSIYVSTNETMDSFLGKLHEVGIQADFDNSTGIFSIGVSAEDINDVGNTNILNKLKITNINYGYTGNQLKIEESYEEYHQATESTLLSNLGVHTGTITLSTAYGTYEVTLDSEDTVGSLISALTGEGIEAAFSNGVFSINNATIENDGTTGLIEAFGFSAPSVASQTQESGGLTYQTVYTSTTTAGLDTLLKEIDGVVLEGDETIVVQNNSGVTSTITVGTTTSIQDLLDAMNDPSVGLSASLDSNGVLNINNGWIIEGGTFDVESAFGLEYIGVAATVTGDALTVTTTTITGATGATKLKDLTSAVTSGTIVVTDAMGNSHQLAIDENDTIDTFTADIRALGLGASFDNTTGMLTLVGGSYTTNGLAEADKSNILNVFFGADTLTPSAIDSAASTSQALRVSATTTVNATGSTTLRELGLNEGTYTATFRTGNSNVTVDISGNTSLNTLVSDLRAAGIDAEFNTDTHKLQITDGEFISVSGGNFDEVMNFTSTITGRYATSDIVMAQNITTPREVTSAGAVYYDVSGTTTVTNVVTTTTAIDSTGNSITYQEVTTITEGGTVGVTNTGDALTSSSVSTTVAGQTSNNLTYTVTTPDTYSTSTAGKTATSGVMGSSESTAAVNQTSGELTYTVTTPETYSTSTAGMTATSGVMGSSESTSAVNQTSGTLTYDVITPESYTTTTEGITVATDVLSTGGAANTLPATQTSTLSVSETIYAQTTATVGATLTCTGVTVLAQTVVTPRTGDVITYTTESVLGGNTTVGISRTWTKQLTYTSVSVVTTTASTTGCSYLIQSNQLLCTVTTTASQGTYVLGTTGEQVTYGVDYYVCSSSSVLASSSLHTTTGAVATGSTTLQELGMNSSSGFRFYVCGNSTGEYLATVTITKTDTLDSFAQKIIDTGHMSAWLDSNGHFKVNQGNGTKHLTGCNLNGGSVQEHTNFYNIIEIGNGYSYDITGTVQFAMTEDTSLNSIGAYVNEYTNSYITLRNGTTFTLHSPSTVPGNNNASVHKYVHDVVDFLQSCGYSAGVTDGKLWFTPESGMDPGSAIASMTSSLQTALGISSMNGHYTTTGYTGSTCSKLAFTDTVYSGAMIAIQSKSMSYIGYTDTIVLKKTDGSSITISPNATVKSALQQICNFGLDVIIDGTTYQAGSTIPTPAMSPNNIKIAQSAGAGAALSNVYCIDSNGDGVDAGTFINPDKIGYGRSFTYSSSTTTTTNASSTTALSTLGLTGGSNISGYIVTSNGTVTVRATQTVGTLVNNLKAKLNDQVTFANGRLYIQNDQNNYIISASNVNGNLTTWLSNRGITFGEGITYTSTSGGTTTTTVTIAATSTTTLSQLGLNSNSTFTVQDGSVYTLTSGMTVEQMRQTFVNAGLTASFNNSTGTFTLTQNTTNFVLDADHVFKNLFNFKFGEGFSYSIDSGGTTVTIDCTATGSTTLEELGIAGGLVFDIKSLSGGGSVSYTITRGQTIDDIVSLLNNHGVTASFTNGALSIGDNDDTSVLVGILKDATANVYCPELGFPDSTVNYFMSGISLTNMNVYMKLAHFGIRDAVTITTDSTSIIFDTNNGLQTFTDLVNYINAGDYGIRASCTTGRFTLTPDEHYVVSLSDNLKTALGTNDGLGYTYTEIIRPIGEAINTIITSATESTTFGELGLTETEYITLSDGKTLRIGDADTISHLTDAAILAKFGITFSLENGILSAGSPTDPNYITGISDNLSSILHIYAGDGYSYNVINGSTVTTTTTLGDLGFDISETGTIITDSTTINVNDTTNLGSLVSLLNTTGGLNADLTSGVLTIGPANGHYLVSMSDNLLSALGDLGVGENISYTTTTSGTAGTTVTHTATGATSLGQLGYNSSGTINAGNGSLYVDEDTTINNLVSFFTTNSITTEFTNGVLSVGAPGDEYWITSIPEGLGSIINISAGNNHSYSITPSGTITDSTTLYERGVTTNITFTTNRDTIVFTVNSNSTFGDLISHINTHPEWGLTASLVSGQFSLTPGEGTYITSISDNFNSILTAGEGITYTSTTSGTAGTTVTHTATGATTLGQLGLTGDGILGSITLSNGQVINVAENTTLGSIISTMTGAPNNMTASITNGVLSVGNDNDAVWITEITQSLGEHIHISAGNNHSYSITPSGTITDSTTLYERGVTTNVTFTTNRDTIVFTVNSNSTFGDLISHINTHPEWGLTASLVSGQFSLTPGEGTYITSISDNFNSILTAGEGITYTSTTSGTAGTTVTHTATGATTLGQLGLTGDGILGSITLSNGQVINVAENTTLGSIISTMTNAPNNMTASITNGVLTIGSDSDTNYVSVISSSLSDLFNIYAGEGHSFNTTTNSVHATSATQLTAFGLDAGTNYLIDTNTGIYTVTGNNTIADVVGLLNTNGYFNASFNESTHQMTIASTEGHYINSITHDLEVALGFHNVPWSAVVDEVTGTYVVTANSVTSLGTLGIPAGSDEIIVTHNGIINVTLAAGATDITEVTIADIISILGNAGITASFNEATGRFSVGDSNDSNFIESMSSSLASALGHLSTGLHFTYETSQHNETVQNGTTSQVTVDTSCTFADLGITSGGTLNFSDGTSLTVNSNTVISDFISDMSDKGFTVTLNNGFFNIRPTGNNIITGTSGSDNILTAMNIYDTPYTVSQGNIANTKLKDLTDSNGDLLGITSGAIKVYKNGLASNIVIDNNTTLEDLAVQLSAYNIQMVYSSGDSGRIYFTGSGNSYLKEVSGGTNLLTALGASTWNTTQNTSSQTLQYDETSNVVINGNTKLVDLKKADGTSVGITEGRYKITAAGINYEGTIDSTTSVDDFLTELAYYGFSGSINSNGQITLNTSNDDTYLVRANGVSGYSNIVDELFTSWTFGNIYNSDRMDVTDINTSNINSRTRLRDIDQGTYEAGKIVVSSAINGDSIIELSENSTVGDFISALSYHGFNSYIDNGRLVVRNDGYTTLKNYSIPSEASNIISLLGLDTSPWEQPGHYEGLAQSVTSSTTSVLAATTETKLSDLEDSLGNNLDISTGEYWIYTNGVKHAVNLSSTDITLGGFMNILSGYGISASLNIDDNQSILKITGAGNSYLATSDAEGASNVVQKLFGNSISSLYDYSGLLQTSELVSNTIVANLGTSVSDYDHGDVKSEGVFALYVNGNYSEINITSYETFGSLIEKFERAGVTASLTNGVFKLETGNRTFVVDDEHTTSNLISNLGLHYSDNLGGFAASSEAVTQTTTTIENRNLSVAKYADMDTEIGLLNISSGSMSIYRNGAKKLITIENTETFSDLRNRIQTAFADNGNDVTIDFVNGKLRIYSTTEGVDVQVGSSNDTSNISSICGFSQDENGYIVSARELYKVNASSLITGADLFRYGNVTEGTFIVGDETFTINSNTTIQNIVAQINSSDKSNASAYWDSVDGKLVITSRTTGASMVNIEAGTSNFTDILGLTASEWNGDGSVSITRILLDSQELGNNARFSINGTNFQSSSNVITSDVSRIQGLTLNLKGSSMGDTVTVTVSKDAEAVTEAVGEFVEAYNDFVENVDEELSSSGVLKDQTTLKFIRQQIRNLLVNTFAGATTFRNLAAIGISTSAGNTVSAGDTSKAGIEYLYFDAEKFMDGYNKDSDAVKNMLVGSDETPGILLQIENIVESALTTGTGYFSTADKSYTDRITSINEKIRKANQAIEAYRARLEAKFQSMDLLISQMQNQYNSFLSSSALS